MSRCFLLIFCFLKGFGVFLLVVKLVYFIFLIYKEIFVTFSTILMLLVFGSENENV